MKNIIILVNLIFALSYTGFAQSDTIITAQLKSYIDKSIVLKGTLMGMKEINDRNGQPIMFLDIDDTYPNTKIGVTIFPEAFKEIKLDKSYIGKTILISGTLSIHKDKPNLAINDVKQISWAEK